MDMKKLLKPVLAIVLIILISSVLARLLTDGESLAEYARNNPELAYATPATTVDPGAATSEEDDMTASATAPSTTPAVLSAPSPSPTALPVLSMQTPSPDSREVYQTDFYQEALSDRLISYITGISYPMLSSDAEVIGNPIDPVDPATSTAPATTTAPATSSDSIASANGDRLPVFNFVNDADAIAVAYEDLRFLNVLYYDFDGVVQTGELICNKAIANDLLEIFYELYCNEYPIERIRLIEEYHGDDTLSMTDNNTSCFNYRVVDGSSSLSKHALGLALDINPFYNPYVVDQPDGSLYISPKGSEGYVDRSADFPHKIDDVDLCYKLFIEHGFTWGGNWNTPKDYQHFQKAL
ncbi:MAG: M15 family metallopeptidase [Lachnospiraceae bacterium]|jgi:hypothetical protein|nr:M15 family metallopeptidase [Lachnospiraceae bacterium]